jgi:RNA polymerase sigma-70 factor, ECF subfamily
LRRALIPGVAPVQAEARRKRRPYGRRQRKTDLLLEYRFDACIQGRGVTDSPIIGDEAQTSTGLWCLMGCRPAGGRLDNQEPTDAELVDAIRRTDGREGVEELVRRHTGRVRRIVYPLVLNDADADDVTQEAMVRALNGLDGFRSDAAFATWLRRVALNAARNFLRGRNRRATVLATDDPPADAADEPFRTPACEAEAAELDRAIGDAMGRLPAEQRIALSLVAIERLDEKEAARVAGCAHATLRWRVYRARQRLRRLLGDALR